MSAAMTYGADAIHPGYGFLSENAAFAALCEKEGITFIAPSAKVISMMGDKVMAKRMAEEAGAPTIPVSTGMVSDMVEAKAVAAKLGYPVILKSAAGGGSRGMRVVWNEKKLAEQYADAAREAKVAFGDDSIYVEKYLTGIRHVEIQILSNGASMR